MKRAKICSCIRVDAHRRSCERADYLSIWVEEAAGGNETKVIELAKKFLEQHALSPFASEVRMKLAELYYRRQDFANAQTQFELIAQNNADSSLAEKHFSWRRNRPCQAWASTHWTGRLFCSIRSYRKTARCGGQREIGKP